MTLVAADPALFNDPFEVRPCFDQERHDYFASTHEAFHAQFGFSHSLLGTGSMVGLPTENAVDFGEQINERFRRDLSRRFRVVCLSRDPSSVLMWGHYTKSHSGLVLGIDTSVPRYPSGLKPEGFEIQYPSDGSRIKLPLGYYRGISVEQYDLSGRVVNRPDELVQGDGGLLIPFSEYWRRVESASIALLSTKNLDWAYEKEVRFIYELPTQGNQLRIENGRCFLPIPPTALREVILGFRAPFTLTEEVVNLFKAGRLGNPLLFHAGCHPYRYEVQRHQDKPDYLLDYYKAARRRL